METRERKVCRLCLKVCNKFKALDGDIKGALNTILPNIILTATQEAVICTNCTEVLFKCSDFKAECICTQNYIVPFVDNNDTVKLDLKDVYLSKNENCTGVTEDQDICGFCLGSVKSCFAIFLNVKKEEVVLEEMIRRCLPELDLSTIKKPIICPPCHDSLETCFRFVMNCLSVEDKIKNYCETLDVDSKDQVKLSHLLQFTMRDVITGEADGNLVGIIKEEKLHCEERGNADDMDNVIFKNEEGFIPENVFACKEESKSVDIIKVENEGLCEENNLKEENLEKMEDRKYLLNEEIEIKTDASDFCRLEDGVVVPNLELDLSKPCVKQKTTNKNLSEIKMYQCECCFFQTKYKHYLKRHSLKHKDPSKVTIYKCDFCLYQTIQKDFLKKHLLNHKDPSEVLLYKCDHCSLQTRLKSNLRQHLLVHKDPSEVTMYKCDSCSFQTKHKTGLKKHSVKHKDPSYKCDSCFYQTRYKDSFTIHVQKHKDPSKVQMYKCASCSFQTNRKRHLSRHFLIHKDPLKVTMFKCGTCSFQTKYKEHHKRHLRIHENQTKYKVSKNIL